MTDLLVLPGDRTRDDLRTLLSRAHRFGDTGVRLTAHGEIVLVTVPVTASAGLLDVGATILGMRGIRLAHPGSFDAVVPIGAVVDALARGADLQVPDAGTLPAWASVSPPRSGWERVGTLAVPLARAVAQRAASDLEAALPTSPGEVVVRRVTRAVWSAPVEDQPALSVGACVALDALGFLTAADDVVVTRAGGWVRASTRLGDVLER